MLDRLGHLHPHQLHRGAVLRPDGDGWGDDARPVVACDGVLAATGEGVPVRLGGDCLDDPEDPMASAVHPEAEEVCDDLDNDCNGVVDDGTDGLATWYADADGDGEGDTGSAEAACERPPGAVDNGRDCDDADPAVHSGATEVCDGIDNDCDGTVNQGASDAPTWYGDADEDGHGDATEALAACDAPDGYAAAGDDCDDADAASHPDADEICNDADNDCDGEVDEDATDALLLHRDTDGDGYGVDGGTLTACEASGDYVEPGGDCDDTDADISPGEPEDLGEANDADCDGTVEFGADDLAGRGVEGIKGEAENERAGAHVDLWTSDGTPLLAVATVAGSGDEARVHLIHRGLNPGWLTPMTSHTVRIDNETSGDLYLRSSLGWAVADGASTEALAIGVDDEVLVLLLRDMTSTVVREDARTTISSGDGHDFGRCLALSRETDARLLVSEPATDAGDRLLVFSLADLDSAGDGATLALSDLEPEAELSFDGTGHTALALGERRILWANLDADGEEDVVTEDAGSGTLAAFFLDDPTLPLVLLDSAASELGADLATGDLDGDGYADVVAGAPGAGAVYLLWGDGSLAGGTTSVTGWTDATTILGEPDYADWGASVSTGTDLDEDGLDDLAVGGTVDGGTMPRGEVVVAFGASLARGATLSDADVDDAIVVGSGETFGQLLRLGNVDNSVHGLVATEPQASTGAPASGTIWGIQGALLEGGGS